MQKILLKSPNFTKNGEFIFLKQLINLVKGLGGDF